MQVKLVRFRQANQTAPRLSPVMRRLSRSSWMATCIGSPVILESSEEYQKDHDHASTSSSTASMESSFADDEEESSWQLGPEPTSPLSEDQEVVLIDPVSPRPSPPISHHRSKSAEALLESSVSPQLLQQQQQHPPDDSTSPAADTRDDDKPAPPPAQKCHRRFASAPPAQWPLPQGTTTANEQANLEALHTHLQQLKIRYYPTHPQVAATYNLMGNIYFRQRRFSQALVAYKKAVECEPGDHLGDAYANLGTVYWSTGALNEAVTFLRKALRVHEYQQVRAGHALRESLAVASIRHQMGLVYTLQHQHQQSSSLSSSLVKAHQCLAQALKIRERVLGKGHLDVARTVDAMGKVYLLDGDYQSALLCHERAFRIKENVMAYPEKSKSLCESLVNIAAVQRARNDLEGAIFTSTAIVEMQKEELRAERTQNAVVEVARALDSVGELYVASKQTEKAQNAYNEADRFYDAAQVAVQDRPPRARIAPERDTSIPFDFNCFDISCENAADIFYDASGLNKVSKVL